jgi:hypothetical protein
MTAEPSSWKEIVTSVSKLVETLTKPLATVTNAISERLEVLLRRKPKLYVNFRPSTTYWCLANEGQTRIMQLGFAADFSHDDLKQTLVLINGYPEGTRPRYSFTSYIAIRAGDLVSPSFQLNLLVLPVLGEEGKDWMGRIVFVDQWHRTYKSKATKFMWAGPRQYTGKKNMNSS